MSLSVSEVIFGTLAIVTVASALAAVESRNLVRAATSLMIMSISLAGLYYLLSAGYLSAFQIAVYVGAVVSLILFTVMLFPPEEPSGKPSDEAAGLLSFALILGALVLMIVNTAWAAAVRPVPIDPVGWASTISRSLLERYTVPLLTLALTLAAALIGALTLAKTERGEGEI